MRLPRRRAARRAAGASRGTLVVATGAAGAPMRGADLDLARAMANLLGYRISFVRAAPGAIVPGLASGEYDLGMSVLDTAARERAVDVVTLGPVGAASGIAIPKASGLTAEVMGALRTLIAEGTYREILATWDLPVGRLTRPALNAAAHAGT